MRVIVVDDEEIIRKGIVELMPWDALGYQVVGEAEDGEEALALIEAEQPDVVITDIKMPFITGIELLKRIKQMYTPLYTILLTGYDEFKFAQEAVNHGAYSYLLKPVDPSELGRILTEIRADFEENKELGSIVKSLTSQTTFKKVLYGMGDIDEVITILSDEGHDASALWFSAFILEIDDHASLEQSEQTGNIKSLIYEAVSGDAQTVITENKGFTSIVVVWKDSANALKNHITELISQARAVIE